MKPDLLARLLELRSKEPSKKQLTRFFAALDPDERAELDNLLITITSAWSPLPGPQTLAYNSDATILLYGGSAGGGKTDLLLGVGLKHRRSIIFRRVFPNLKAIVDRSHMIYRRATLEGIQRAEYKSSPIHRWSFPNGSFIDFDSIQHEKNVTDYQGNPHDYYGFDEVTEFSEYMIRFVTTWLRPMDFAKHSIPEQVICTCNPPTTAEGYWIISFWGPWLDEQHPNPASPGELRWFTTINGKDKEVDGPDPIKHKGEVLIPKSRTFIPASLDDNPYLINTGYRGQLQQLPEPLRSKMLYGDFKAGVVDDVNQLIPTAWIKAAQARWREIAKPKGPPDSLGVDVSRGGRDRTVLTPQWGDYYGEQIQYPGKFIEDGDKVCIIVLNNSAATTTVKVDVIGVGSSAYDSTKKVRRTIPMNASERTDETDRSGLLHFKNSRSLWYWGVRESLDPERPGGCRIAIPDSKELLADLAAPTVKISSGVIEVESKDQIIDRLGRSPDCGDSFVYAHSKGKMAPGQGLLELLANDYRKFQIEEAEYRKRYGH
jgi:Terminase large subunit, T4likevirus-type, N-terminal